MRITKGLTQILALSLLSIVLIASDAKAQNFNLCADASCVFLPMVAYDVPLKVQNVRIGASGRPRESYIALQGEVVNTGPQPFYDVTVELTLYSGMLINTITLDTMLYITPSGSANPFSLVSRYISYPDRIEARVIRWRTEPSFEYVPLTVVSVQALSGLEQGIFNIVLRNDHPTAVSTVRGVVWSFPIERSITVANLTDVILQPSETYTWRALLICDPHVCDPRVAAEAVPVP